MDFDSRRAILIRRAKLFAAALASASATVACGGTQAGAEPPKAGDPASSEQCKDAEGKVVDCSSLSPEVCLDQIPDVEDAPADPEAPKEE